MSASSLYITGSKSMPIPMGTETVSVLLSCPVATTDLALNSIIAMGYLPEGCEFVDAIHGATDLDTNGTPAVAMSFGVLNSGLTDLDGTALEASIQVGRAGTAARFTPTVAALTLTATDAAAKPIGYKVTTAAATAAAGTVYCAFSYRTKS